MAVPRFSHRKIRRTEAEYKKDCAPVENGSLSGRKLTFGFDPEDVGGLANLELSGDVLEGTLHSDKCACELPYTFHRL